MITSLHTVSRLDGGLHLYGLTCFQPRWGRQAAILFIADRQHSEAAATALVVRQSFGQVQPGWFAPGTPLWHEHVLPCLDKALASLTAPLSPLKLGGALVQATRYVQDLATPLSGGGCVVIPEPPLPKPMDMRKIKPPTLLVGNFPDASDRAA